MLELDCAIDGEIGVGGFILLWGGVSGVGDIGVYWDGVTGGSGVGDIGVYWDNWEECDEGGVSGTMISSLRWLEKKICYKKFFL